MKNDRPSDDGGMKRRTTAGSDESSTGASDPDWKTALWVLNAGGTVRVDAAMTELKSVNALPKKPFKLTAMSLTKPVKDADLAAADRGARHTLEDLLYVLRRDLGDREVVGLAELVDFAQIKFSGRLLEDLPADRDLEVGHRAGDDRVRGEGVVTGGGGVASPGRARLQKIGSSDASAWQCFFIRDKSGLAPANASTV